ncbi:uncharacterized protein F5Z01DRAFT_48187 [Emericellopsis atlantica]|uniref:Uncharacterized protein n=1 Tax=Emericellopsis atlantica TaxID=2614577 RepID=A0A9P7ZNS2_9HYPO|nr:uncharacterized protein F5Z01DRAFT_48187 [Emericellopsis atlantica]KAG9255326.1 hypothetical protein F5Z01DRAFT_48187 [Emericellopsis atlantica]
MDSLNAGYSPGYLPMMDSNNVFLNDWNTQMAIAEASRRLRKGYATPSNGSKMRVSKPASASTSPVRRRANGNDIAFQQQCPQARTDRTARPSRPLSWHPNACFYTPQPYQEPSSCYPFSTPSLYTTGPAYYPPQQQQQFSPNMAAFSTNASPSSACSPLPLGYSQANVPQYVSPEAWQQHTTPYYPDSSHQMSIDGPPTLTYARGSGTPDDWSDDMAVHNMSQTNPPTPEAFVNTKAPQPAVSGESAMIDGNDEDEGEILVGMGLYDTATKYDQDPQLDNYRSTVSSLLGSVYRPSGEATGKGLTLEEAWEPPKSDEEEDGDDE